MEFLPDEPSYDDDDTMLGEIMAYLTSIIGENDVFEVSSSSYITPLDAEYSDCKIELSGEYLRAVDMDNILI